MLISSEAYYLTLVEKNRKSKERRKGVAIEKSRALTGGKRINERASFVYNL